MGLLDYALLAAVLALAGLALWRMHKQKGCGGGCAGCPHSGACSKEEKDEQRR